MCVSVNCVLVTCILVAQITASSMVLFHLFVRTREGHMLPPSFSVSKDTIWIPCKNSLSPWQHDSWRAC